MAGARRYWYAAKMPRERTDSSRGSVCVADWLRSNTSTTGPDAAGLRAASGNGRAIVDTELEQFARPKQLSDNDADDR